MRFFINTILLVVLTLVVCSCESDITQSAAVPEKPVREKILTLDQFSSQFADLSRGYHVRLEGEEIRSLLLAAYGEVPEDNQKLADQLFDLVNGYVYRTQKETTGEKLNGCLLDEWDNPSQFGLFSRGDVCEVDNLLLNTSAFAVGAGNAMFLDLDGAVHEIDTESSEEARARIDDIFVPISFAATEASIGRLVTPQIAEGVFSRRYTDGPFECDPDEFNEGLTAGAQVRTTNRTIGDGEVPFFTSIFIRCVED